MAYVRKTWKDAPDTSTPINAVNLNHMEDGIAEADVNARNALNRLDNVDDEITQINSNLSNKQNKTDNSLATTSKTVVGAINELKNNLTWTLLATVTGDTAINLPSTFKEIHVRVWMPTSTSGVYVENNFLYEDFNRQTFRYLHTIGGWYYVSSNNGWCTLADVNGQIYLNSAFYGGTNITSECQVKVYYR